MLKIPLPAGAICIQRQEVLKDAWRLRKTDVNVFCTEPSPVSECRTVRTHETLRYDNGRSSILTLALRRNSVRSLVLKTPGNTAFYR